MKLVGKRTIFDNYGVVELNFHIAQLLCSWIILLPLKPRVAHVAIHIHILRIYEVRKAPFKFSKKVKEILIFGFRLW